MAQKAKKELRRNLVYAGAQIVGLKMNVYHRYIKQGEGEGEGNVYFKRKMHANHKVGMVYSVLNPQEGSYRIDDVGIAAVAQHDNSKDIVRWLKEDEGARRAVTAKRERAKLISTARKAVQGLRAMYKRASFNDKNDILRVIVEELESD